MMAIANLPVSTIPTNAQPGMQYALGTGASASPAPAPWSGSQADLINLIIGQTNPLRTMTTQRLQDVLSGGIPISSMPQYAPLRAAIEGQFSTAEKQLQSSLPRGGLLGSSMADLLGKR